MALGAERSDIVRMVLQGAMLQAGLGLLIGVPVALLCARYVQSQLFQVSGSRPGRLNDGNRGPGAGCLRGRHHSRQNERRRSTLPRP